MDGTACLSLGSLLASGTEVALLNTALPHLFPNTTAHFKVNCLCGAVSSPLRGTRLLLFVWNLYCSLPTGVFWYVGVAGWCLASCRHTEAQTHVQHMNRSAHPNARSEVNKNPRHTFLKRQQTACSSCIGSRAIPYLNLLTALSLSPL